MSALIKVQVLLGLISLDMLTLLKITFKILFFSINVNF